MYRRDLSRRPRFGLLELPHEVPDDAADDFRVGSCLPVPTGDACLGVVADRVPVPPDHEYVRARELRFFQIWRKKIRDREQI